MVSIIIVNYNTKRTTAKCLKSVFAYCTSAKEVIVVDNNSSDGSGEFLEKNFPSVKILKNKKNLGFARANNQGAAQARGDILFFLNSDVLIQRNIISVIEEDLYQYNNRGVAAPSLLTEQRVEQEHSHGDFPGLFSLVVNKLKTGKKKKTKDGIIETDWVSGAALAVKKRVYDRVGGFDEGFFMYFEDIDLCRRIKDQGYKVIQDKRISLIHRGGVSFGNAYKKKKQYYYRSQDYYFTKNHGKMATGSLKALRYPCKLFKMK